MINPSTLTDKELLESLCEIEEGLTDWEVERVDEWAKIVDMGRPLSQGRRSKAEEIFRDRT